MNILILEDEYSIILNIIEKLKGSDVIIYPNRQDERQSVDDDYSNYKNLTTIFKSDEEQIENEFAKILNKINNIDLFIVDIGLKGNDDILGVKFINFLSDKWSNYNNGNYKIIVLTGFGKQSSQVKQIENTEGIEFIYKKNYGGVAYADKIAEFIDKEFKITSPQGYNKEGFFSEKRLASFSFYSDKIISLFFIVFLAISLIYALAGISSDTLQSFYSFKFKNMDEKVILGHNQTVTNKILPDSTLYKKGKTNEDLNIFDEKEALKNKRERQKSKTQILEYVEHFFLYLLPFFVILGFFNYYRLTTGVKLDGGKTSQIDHDEALKSLNTTKTILLSTLLSFTIIKILDNVLIENQTDITSLISYGVLLVILMAYIVIQNLSHKSIDKH